MNDKFIGTTVAKKATVKLLDDGTYNLEDKDINIKTGIEINNAKEFQKLGTYTIPKPDTEEVSGNMSFTGYDYMKKFDTLYVDNNTYPIRLDACLENLCSQVGLLLGNKNFPNNSYMLKGNPFTNRETRKTVLSNLVQLTGGFAEIDAEDGKLYVRNLDVNGEAVETIDGNNYDEFKPNNVFGPVNSVRILMNSGVDGEETIKEAEGVTDENRCQITIADNYYLTSAEEREAVINAIFNALKGLTYLPIELSYYGYPWLKLGDKIKVKDKNDNEYVTYVMEHILKYNGAYSGTIKAIALTKTQQAYKEVLSLKEWRRNTELAVNKIDGKITAVAEETTENSKKITEVEQDINGVTTKVSSVETEVNNTAEKVNNITNTQASISGKNIHIEDSAEEPFVETKLKGSTFQSTRSGKNIFNKNATYIYKADNIEKEILDTGVRIKTNRTYTENPRLLYVIKLGNVTDFLGKTVRIKTTALLGNESLKAMFYIGTCNDAGTSRRLIERKSIGKGVSGEMFLSTLIPSEQGGMYDNFMIALYATVDTPISSGDYVDYTDLIVTIDNDDMTYEDYGASPSPDYPSEIENIEGKNLLDLSKCSFSHCVLNSDGKSITCNIVDYYWAQINTSQFNTYLLKNKGKTLTFSTGTVLSKNTSVVIYGTRSDGSTFQEQNEASTGKCTFTVANDFTKITSVEFRINRQNSKYTDTSTIINYVMLEEGTQATPYVPYNSLEIKDVGKNLLNVFSGEWVAYGSVKQADGSIKANVSNAYYGQLRTVSDKWKEYFLNNAGKTLTFSVKESFSNYALCIVIYGKRTSTKLDYQSVESNAGKRSVSIKIADDFTSISDIELRYFRKIPVETFIDTTSVISELQLEEGSTATPYTPYQEQKVTFPLAEGQKLMEGSYLASDGIHHTRKQVVFDGSDDEGWEVYQGQTPNEHVYYTGITNSKKGLNTSICSHFKNKVYAWDVGKIGEYSDHPTLTYKYFVTDKASITDWKLWLSQNPITVEYELAEEEIVPYTTEQQEAWDKIEQLHTYKNVTNIFSDAELDIVYVRDNGLSDMYETKQNASKNYAKTVEKFAEQKITTDEINQKVAVVNEKLTEYKQNIDSFSFTTENAGGINLIQNSTLENGLDLYHSTTGTVSIEKNMDVKEKTISKSAIKIINGTVITQEINVIPLEDYTFSCLVYKTELTNVTIKIVSDKIEEYQIEAEPETWQKFSANINSSDNSVIIEIICDNNFCYISDRILNKGNAPLGWQRHNGEFKSDNVTINEDGITVTNTNDNMKHVITSSEDKIINTLNGKTEVSFNPDETKMNSTRINEKLTKGKVRETVRDDGTVMVTMDD